jgi:hypothetical protein
VPYGEIRPAELYALAAFAGGCRKAAEEPPAAETALAAAEAPTVEIGGVYAGTATDGAGRFYECELVIVGFRAGMYDVTRRVGGGEPFSAVALLSGGTFAVGFNDGSRYGVAAYNINPDGSLAGVSACEGDARVARERWPRSSPRHKGARPRRGGG